MCSEDKDLKAGRRSANEGKRGFKKLPLEKKRGNGKFGSEITKQKILFQQRGEAERERNMILRKMIWASVCLVTVLALAPVRASALCTFGAAGPPDFCVLNLGSTDATNNQIFIGSPENNVNPGVVQGNVGANHNVKTEVTNNGFIVPGTLKYYDLNSVTINNGGNVTTVVQDQTALINAANAVAVAKGCLDSLSADNTVAGNLTGGTINATKGADGVYVVNVDGEINSGGTT